jgi:hypothetical protein
MIDFVKLRINNPDIKGIRDNPAPEWTEHTNHRTGEVIFTGKFNCLSFRIVGDRFLSISGSLHKYWNSLNERGEQNYNDFSFLELTQAIESICTELKLDPRHCIIQNLEFGVNISPQVPVEEILNSLLTHKGKPFTRVKEKEKHYWQVRHIRYYVKIYNKGLQYKRDGNNLRIEIKTVKMIHLKSIGIKTLYDLLDPSKVYALGLILTADFNELLFYDYTIQEEGIPLPERLILSNGKNPYYWEELKKKGSRYTYYKTLKKFKVLVKEYGTRDLAEILRPLIVQKYEDLFTGGGVKIIQINRPAEIDTSTTPGPDFLQINRHSIGLICINLPRNHPAGSLTLAEEVHPERRTFRFCLSCGRDISHQRPGSKFCSPKYVGEKPAHKCRNRDSNPRNNLKNMIERDTKRGLSFLFDPFKYANVTLNNS